MSSNFRTDIQALRGIAVSLVLVYHAGIGPFGAGYLGVDIFFVISGYLITRLIKNSIDAGNFRFTEFYFRRAKRLLPAAYITFFVTSLLAPFILDAQTLQDFFKQLIGAVTFTGNIALFLQAGYFGGEAELKPLLHVWSLSLEEQYYLLIPAMLYFLPRKYWLAAGLALLVSSMALCFVLIAIKPIATFYLLPTRAWELGIGSLGAIAATNGPRTRSILTLLFWPALLALLVVPIFPTGLPHPGVDALIVCVSTLIVILREHSVLNTTAISRAMARIGDVSYSLYLAHWPVFAFLKNASVSEITVAHNVAALLIGIFLGILLFRYVELPTRRIQLKFSGKLVGTGVIATFAILAVPAGVAMTPTSGPDYAQVRRPNDGFSSECVYDADFYPKPECQNSDQPSVLVWGDSYAMHLVGGIAATSTRGVIQATRGMCGPIIGIAPLSDHFYVRSWAESCISFNQSVLNHLAASPSIEIVVISSPFRQYLTASDSNRRWRTLANLNGNLQERDVGIQIALDLMDATINTLRSLGKRVVIVAAPPTAGFNVGACLERRAQGKLILGSPSSDCSIPLDAHKDFNQLPHQFLEALSSEADVTVLNFDSTLCDENNCAVELGGTFLYVDRGHLTIDGGKLLARTLSLGELIETNAR